jgi:membrane protease YdiL (CAAX protease family)
VDGDLITQVWGALLVLTTLTVVIRSVVRGRTLAQRVEARPDGRVWLYRTFVLRMWPLMLMPVATVWASNRITVRDLGWAWPHGAAGYLFTAYYVLIIAIVGVRIRRAMRRGVVIAQRRRVAFMTPRTTRERWWAVALALTAGATEEVLFRGGLLAVGTEVYHLPLVAAAAAALVLFAAGHLYQGWRGLLGSALVGFVFTVIFAVSGSLLLAVVAHAVHDLISLLLIPGESTPQPPAEEPETPAEPSASTTRVPRPAAAAGPPTVRSATPG